MDGDRTRADAAADGDEPAGILEIYHATLPILYAYVARRCGGSRELAEDVVQETYLRAVRAWSSSPVPEEPLAWLRTVARNLIVSHARRRLPRQVDPAVVERVLAGGSIGSRDDESNGGTTATSAARTIMWGLAKIEPKAAHLIEAFHLDGKPVRLIAEETGLSERAVEGRLHRARRKLRRVLMPVMQESERR